MQLPLPSLIPSVLEITSFIYTNWPQIWWFPNWYLGIPLRLVTGPVVPFLLILLKSVLVYPTFLQLYLGLIGVCWLIGSIGVYFLARMLGAGKRQAQLSWILFLLGPFSLFLLSFGSGLSHISLSLVPWILMCWWKGLHAVAEQSASVLPSSRFAPQNDHIAAPAFFWLALAIIGMSISLLISVSSGLALIVGLSVITLFFRNRIHLSLLVVELGIGILMSGLIATLWYSPQLWWTMLTNPSFGGKPLYAVISYVWQLVQALIPVLLGVWVVQKRYRLSNQLLQFAVLFSASFGLLTLIRFLSDIDFWMDWTSYGLELQLGLALLLPVFFRKTRYASKQIVTLLCILLLSIINLFLVWKIFIQDSVKISNFKFQISNEISKVNKSTEKVFLSGSPVFWLSAPQVRGGKDEVATHQTWAMGAYQIREGESAELLKNWLAVFGVSRVLVHEADSQEYFRDYTHTERFKDFVSTTACLSESSIARHCSADVWYLTPFTIARVVAKNILQIPKPTAGNDAQALAAYVQTFKNISTFLYTNPHQIDLSLSKILTGEEVISVAVTYDPRWKLTSGKGKVVADAFGNLVIIPEENNQNYSLKYHESWWSWSILVPLILISGGVLWYSPKIARFFQRKAILPLENTDEEEQY